jgi:hypothetical protein
MKKLISLFFAFAISALCFGQISENRGVMYKISGYLTYDNNPSPAVPLPNTHVYLKDGPEPVPPATTPLPAILKTTITEADGYYEFLVDEGIYYIYASGSCTWDGVDNDDVMQIRRYLAGLTSSLDGNPLRIRAADVSLDGIINGTDIIAVRRRIAGMDSPAYIAPDWLYENPGVSVTTHDITLNFKGICSAEVNGSNLFPSCAPILPPTEVPVSNWALFLGIGLVLAYTAMKFRKVV